jgi:superfamily I DNA and/or RNA helicase
MERLMANGYDNTVTLTVQNRMAPEIMELANRLVYQGRLTCGPHAPPGGRVEIRRLPEGREEAIGTSYRNNVEVDAALSVQDLADEEDVVFLCPYVAQCRLFLSKGTSRPVHTVDSFQGREADVVILSMVRDGTSGVGFWSDIRRVNVALTRARRRLIVLVSNLETGWPSGTLRDIMT